MVLIPKRYQITQMNGLVLILGYGFFIFMVFVA